MIDAGLYALLSTTATITDICATRISPVALPVDEQLPALTYQIISSTSYPTFNTSGYQRWRLQFDCWGTNYSDAVGLRAALIKTLNGYQGALPNGQFLQNADLLQITDFFEDDARVFRCMVEFYIYFDFQN